MVRSFALYLAMPRDRAQREFPASALLWCSLSNYRVSPQQDHEGGKAETAAHARDVASFMTLIGDRRGVAAEGAAPSPGGEEPIIQRGHQEISTGMALSSGEREWRHLNPRGDVGN